LHLPDERSERGQQLEKVRTFHPQAWLPNPPQPVVRLTGVLLSEEVLQGLLYAFSILEHAADAIHFASPAARKRRNSGFWNGFHLRQVAGMGVVNIVEEFSEGDKPVD